MDPLAASVIAGLVVTLIVSVVTASRRRLFHRDQTGDAADLLRGSKVTIGDIETDLAEVTYLIGPHLAIGQEQLLLPGLLIRAFGTEPSPAQLQDLVAKFHVAGAIRTSEKRAHSDEEPRVHYSLTDWGIRALQWLNRQSRPPEAPEQLDPARVLHLTVALALSTELEAVSVVSATALLRDDSGDPAGGIPVEAVATSGTFVQARKVSNPAGEAHFMYVTPAQIGLVTLTVVADGRAVASVTSEIVRGMR